MVLPLAGPLAALLIVGILFWFDRYIDEPHEA